MAVAVQLWLGGDGAEGLVDPAASESAETARETEPEPIEPPAPVYDEYVLQPQDTLSVAMAGLGAAPAEVARLVAAAEGVYDLGRVRAGNRVLYTLTDRRGV